MEEMLISIRGTSLFEERSHKINHGSDLLQFIHTSREDGHFNDVMICVDGKNIPASKMVLSCFSKYFHKMFTTEMKEKYKDCVEVNGVDVESMNNLVQFMYTGEISINIDSVCYLLAVTDYLQMQSVKQLCIQYLMDATSPQNCFTIQVLAERFNIPVLSENNNKFIIKNYPQVICNDHFKGQSKEVATLFLQETHKQVSSDLVYTAVMNWVKFDLASNESYLEELIKFVDFHEMSPQMLTDVVSIEPLLRKSDADVDKTLKVFAYQMKNMISPGSIFLFGGTSINNFILYSGECYVTSLNKWMIVASMNDRKSSFALVSLEGKTYFIVVLVQLKKSDPLYTDRVYSLSGGVSPSVVRCNPTLGVWENVAPMQIARIFFAAVVLKKAIYALGKVEVL
ncbi:kelch-like protein 12 isoform X3 [Ciona intestinalis]